MTAVTDRNSSQWLGDSGALLRAVELATAPYTSTKAVWRPEVAESRSMEELALALANGTGLLARKRQISASELCHQAGHGTSILARVSSGWLVAANHRATLVTSGGEQSEKLDVSRVNQLAAGEAIETVSVEPRLGLEVLGQAATGSASPWARLRALVHLERGQVAALVLYAMVLGAASLAVPVAVQVLVNTIAFGSLMQPVIVLGAILFGVLSFAGLVQVFEWYAIEVLQRRLFVRVTEDFARRIPAISSDFHERHDLREMANRFFDVVNLQKATGLLLLDGLGLVLQTLVGLTLLALYHPILLAFAVGLVGALLVVVVLGRGAVATAVEESAAKYKVAGWLEQIASAPHLFKQESAALFAAQRADAYTRGYLEARRTHYVRVLRQLCGGVGVQVMAMTILLGLGGWLVIEQELTLGQLVAAEIVVGIIATGFLKIGKLLETSYDLLASLDKLASVVDLPRDPDLPPNRLALANRSIELRDLALAAPRSNSCTPIRQKIEVGARVFVRASGGKDASFLLETLAGLRQPASGEVQVEGLTPTPAQNLSLLRDRAFLVRPCDLIEGSIIDNLRLADRNLDEDAAWSVLKQVGLADAVIALPEGIQTTVLSRGGPLSGAQVARLCLGRALVAEPDLLLIDGALDNLGLSLTRDDPMWELFFGPDAPWTLVVAGKHPGIETRCDATITLRGEDVHAS